jgi:hypothetical protein
MTLLSWSVLRVLLVFWELEGEGDGCIDLEEGEILRRYPDTCRKCSL